MPSLIDFFLFFSRTLSKHKLSAGTIATYIGILNAFNERRYPDEIELSMRELKERAGLKSVASAYESRNVLKNVGLIEFRTKSTTTVYRLVAPATEQLPNTCRTATEQLPNTYRTAGEQSSRLSVRPNLSVVSRRRNETKEDPQTERRGKRDGKREGSSGGDNAQDGSKPWLKY